MEPIEIIVVALFCALCLYIGHKRGHQVAKEEYSNQAKVELIFDEEYNLLGVYCNGKQTINYRARIEKSTKTNNQFYRKESHNGNDN